MKKRQREETAEADSHQETNEISDDTHRKKKKKRNKEKKKSSEDSGFDKNNDREQNDKTTIVEEKEENIYPYEVLDDDHCESPFEAYRDIAPLLNALFSTIKGNLPEKTSLSIYDPYFCEGQMKNHLSRLGFDNVYNKKEDFYYMKRTNQLPDYDILITNPPYSLDHMPKLLDHVSSDPKRRPFCLLLPNYVYMKDYFQQNFNRYCKDTRMFFITPSGNRRYLYTTPKGRRQQKSAHYTSPFPTFWYCGNFSSSEVIRKITEYAQASTQRPGEGIVIARSMYQLPLEVCPDQDPRKKKMRNNLKRKKNKAKKKSIGTN